MFEDIIILLYKSHIKCLIRHNTTQILYKELGLNKIIIQIVENDLAFWLYEVTEGKRN